MEQIIVRWQPDQALATRVFFDPVLLFHIIIIFSRDFSENIRALSFPSHHRAHKPSAQLKSIQLLELEQVTIYRYSLCCSLRTYYLSPNDEEMIDERAQHQLITIIAPRTMTLIKV